MPARSTPEIRAFLIAQLAEQLGVPERGIATDASFASFGLDSLAGLELATALERYLDRELPQTLVWDHPTIDALAAHLGEPAAQVETRAPSPAPSQTRADDPVQIVGAGVRLPGASSMRALGDLLARGEVRRGLVEGHETLSGARASARHATALEDRLGFDPSFFGIAPAEAERMDPQQRLLLEATHWALEDAGLSRASLAGRAVAVIVGASSSDYALRLLADSASIDAHTGTGIALSILANRVSHALGVTGPSFTVDTACSSSLVALHLARASLLAGECELAIVAGVGLVLGLEASLTFAEVGLLSPDGACRPFAEDAAGYRRGDGCVALVLARRSDAQAMELSPRATVLGSAINHGGRSNGLLAPSGAAQERLIERCLEDAGIDATSIDYVEAHGTATPLGDEVEARSLAAAYRAAERVAPLAIGSVKATFGHLEAAAGVTSIAKVLAAMERRELLPTPGVERPRALPRGLSLARAIAPWTGARRAGVSAFGFGGANAHVVLEAAERGVMEPREAGSRVLAFSARSAASLDGALDAALSQLVEAPAHARDALLARMQATLARRDGLEERAALAARDASEAIEVLRARPAARLFRASEVVRAPKVAFVFAGIGEPIRGCLAELAAGEPELAAHVERLARDVVAAGGPDVRPWLLEPAPVAPHALRSSARTERAEDTVPTAVLHPALFVLEHALASRWLRAGVRPSVVLGHSLGELVGAVVAGILELDVALGLVTRRAELFGAVPEGRMLALPLAPEQALALAGSGDALVVAGDNGRDGCVLAGSVAAIDALVARADAADVPCRRLVARHAFHTPSLSSLAPASEALLASAALSPSIVPFVSSLEGRTLDPTEQTTRAYWVSHVHRSLRTAAALSHLLEVHAPDVLVEIGPGASLSRLAVRNAADARTAPRVVPSSGRPGEALARGFVAGLPVELPRAPGLAPVELPYAFDRVVLEVPARAVAAPTGLHRAVERRGGLRALGAPIAVIEPEDDALATLTRALDAERCATVVVRDAAAGIGARARMVAALAACLAEERGVPVPRVVQAEPGARLHDGAAPRDVRATLHSIARLGARAVSEHGWAPETAVGGAALAGLRVAVLGNGALGRRVAAMLAHLGASVSRWGRSGARGAIDVSVELDDPRSLDGALRAAPELVVAAIGASATDAMRSAAELDADALSSAIASRRAIVEGIERLAASVPTVVLSSISALRGGVGLGAYAAAHAAVDLAHAQAGSDATWVLWDHRASDEALASAIATARASGPGALLAQLEGPSRAMRAVARPSARYAAPEGPVEEAVASVLASLLGFARVGRDDDFFALGGTSLLALRAVRELRARFGVDVPIGDVLGTPTVEAIALAIEEALLDEVSVREGAA